MNDTSGRLALTGATVAELMELERVRCPMCGACGACGAAMSPDADEAIVMERLAEGLDRVETLDRDSSAGVLAVLGLSGSAPRFEAIAMG